MQTAANPRSRIITFALTVVLAFGYMAAMQGQADAKPAPPTVTVSSTDASNPTGLCRHTASFLVEGAKGKWASYEAEFSFDGARWNALANERVDIRANPVITVDQGFNGELSLRLRLVKRNGPVTEWTTAPPTSC
jgi:hypothetical protein